MRTNSDHDLAYRSRKKAGLKPVQQPWHWLTSARLAQISKRVLQVAAWNSRRELSAGEGFSDLELRQLFVDELIEQFTTYVTAESHQVAGCWPQGRAALSAVERVQRLETEVAQDWRHQYPAYEKQAHESVASAGGVIEDR